MLRRFVLAAIAAIPGLAKAQQATELSSKVKKTFKLRADQIKPLATGYGGCLATDRITVDGRKVAFCYREKTDREFDSGWCFFAGGETDAYLDDPNHSGIYDVNTIANYDTDIIPLLNAPFGSVFERKDGVGPFEAVTDFKLNR